MGNLLDAMCVPSLIDDPRFNSVQARSANIDAVYATLTAGMKQRTTDEWLAKLRPADILCGKSNGLDDLLTAPYLPGPVISNTISIWSKATR
jgi:crotonobetainyl-CoA:carnitine CoA-transferase CaiB-like acyl-CoA transferase